MVTDREARGVYDPPMDESGKPDYTSLDLPPAPDDRPYVLTNMVMSADGKVVIEGTERGLGSIVDQRLMRELRNNADVVVNGASTLRTSGASPRVRDDDLVALREARGKSRHPIGAVLSGSGDLPLDGVFFTGDDFDAVVYLTEQTPAERREAILATGRDAIVLGGDVVPAMLLHMRRELGAEVVLVEGGPSMNGELFRRGLVDEYFLTLGPVVVGGNGTLSAVAGPDAPTLDTVSRMEIVSAVGNPESSELYLRYRRLGFGALGR
jgi:riboflavin biosynthesis pyrimidine reductase